MQSKKISRFIQGIITRVAINFCTFMVSIFPGEKFAYGFAHLMARITFTLASKQRRIALDSLNIAFGREKSQEEIKKIAFSSFENMSKMAIEFIFFLGRISLMDKYIKVEGIENLDRALAKGKGVVALSGHFGNFPLMVVKLSLQGYKFSTIMRLMRDPWVNQYFEKKRDALGIGSIYTQPRNQCVQKSLETLRNKEILFVQLDQNFGTGGIFVDFFGKKAATAKGTIVFALRAKAPIVPMFICRGEDNIQRVVIEPEAQMLEGKNLEETILLNAEKLTKVIEGYVRRYPADWGWIHRRWKARPKEERQQAQQSVLI
ncbi:lysophospholipid acyltransferase family protein [Candidatus Omnitrophota bacterium]